MAYLFWFKYVVGIMGYATAWGRIYNQHARTRCPANHLISGNTPTTVHSNPFTNYRTKNIWEYSGDNQNPHSGSALTAIGTRAKQGKPKGTKGGLGSRTHLETGEARIWGMGAIPVTVTQWLQGAQRKG